MTQDVQVEQYPALYIGYDVSLDAPDGSQGQNNKKMFIINSFVADFSSLPDPDEFDEDFGTGYTHYAPNPTLGVSYASYIREHDKCNTYVERDSTTEETYSDWRMPTLAEIYMIDILQNIRLSDVKKILEGGWYWSSRMSGAVNFMDPRVGNAATSGELYAAVRCVRDVKDR